MAHFRTFAFMLFIHLVVPEDIKDLSIKQLLQLAEDTSKVREVISGDVTFRLFTQSSEQLLILNVTEIDVTKPTKFIIHGWIANNRRSWYRTMTEEFLKIEDCNVIQVDWEQPARTAYVSAAVNTKLIGQVIAQFVIRNNLPPENLHFIGHSLGAHVSAFAGKKIRDATGAKISRISGLDPAGPFFREYALIKTERLDKDDAKIVDIIHTDAGVYGIDFPVGTLDIYPNLGRAPQPGCLRNINILSLGELLEHSYCSHEISVTYFIEWISRKFHCTLCESWKGLGNNRCSDLDITEEEVNENVTGICIAKTHYHTPFLT